MGLQEWWEEYMYSGLTIGAHHGWREREREREKIRSESIMITATSH